MKALETSYKGYRFRSRLEARWAVFLDTLGITWLYEHQGYKLADGTCYLPDFWLPTFSGGMHVEVKPDGGDFGLARRFALEADHPVWLAEGVPDFRAWNVAYPPAFPWGDQIGIPNADQAQGCDRMFWAPGYEDERGFFDPGFAGGTFERAVMAVRAARFEHGEAPRA